MRGRSSIFQELGSYGERLGGLRLVGDLIMKFLILPALVVAGLATSVSGAFADGNTPDFYAIQRNEPYAGAWSEGAPPAEVAPMQHRIVARRKPS